MVNVFVLIDSRLPPQKIDIQFINQLGEWEVPFSLVFTKSDKNTQKDTAKNIKYFMFELLKTWESAPPYFVTSTVKKTGRKEILAHIEELIETMGK
jgi:GTP-binding protein